jgi:translation elongation factor P/translation initiation factor 5A
LPSSSRRTSLNVQYKFVYVDGDNYIFMEETQAYGILS